MRNMISVVRASAVRLLTLALGIPLLSLGLAVPMLIPIAAHADDYGCKVLLCLADPQGPMTQTECRPPIRRFIEGQSKRPRDPFPTCPEGAPATMVPNERIYDPCPLGTDALADGARALQMTAPIFQGLTGLPVSVQMKSIRVVSLPPGATWQLGIGEGAASLGNPQNKVCVANPIGTLLVAGNSNDVVDTAYGVYERVVTIAPATQTRVIDIFIGGKLFRSVRY